MIGEKILLLVFVFSHLATIATWPPATCDLRPANDDVVEEPIKLEEKMVLCIDDKKVTKNNASYEQKIKSLRKLTFDEKCERGIDIGIGYHGYSPYVHLHKNATNMLYGIFPEVTKELMKCCCPKSNITYGKYFTSIADIRESITYDSAIDITFPVYGQEGKASTHVKDFAFIPIATAPKIDLVVDDRLFQERNSRLEVVMRTILNAWPMLAFITLSAMLAGLIVWVLDYRSNPEEFPPSFFTGSWEGIWWAFVTMTTVGYGDRSPKSSWARAFCILWILMGVILISLFTGLVTSALSASTVPVFNIPGSKIGAVAGSIELQTGVGMNADMQSYKNHDAMLDALGAEGGLRAAMLDNFVLSASADVFRQRHLRMERELETEVTYGMVIGHNSPKMEKCFRKLVRWYPQRIFSIISNKLIPIENPTDNVRAEVDAAQKLFYEHDLFKVIVYTEIGLFLVAFTIGMIWELKFSGNKTGKRKWCFGTEDSTKASFQLVKSSDPKNLESLPENLQTLVTEYNSFHSMWVEKVIRIAHNKNMEGNQF